LSKNDYFKALFVILISLLIVLTTVSSNLNISTEGLFKSPVIKSEAVIPIKTLPVITIQPECGVGMGLCGQDGSIYEYSPETLDIISCEPNLVVAMCTDGKIISGGCHCGDTPITRNYPESGSGDSNGWNGSFSAWLCQCESATDKFVYIQCLK
jgi:hypothetical protein